MSEELWRPVVGFERDYIISSHGRIQRISWTRRTDRTMLGMASTHGYRVVSMTVNNNQNSRYIHRLVAEAFIPNPESKPQVNHIDGNKQNNHITNLEWVSSRENILHRGRVLGKEIGETHHAATLTREKVLRIKGLIRAGKRNIEIAALVGALPKRISNIRLGKIWSHVQLPAS